MLEVMLGAAGGSGKSAFFVMLPNTTFINGGSSVEYTIYPENHIVGYEYHWELDGELSSDLVNGTTSGSITFTKDSPETLTFQTLEDEFADGDKELYLVFKINPGSSTEISRSDRVMVSYSSHPIGDHLQVAGEAREWTVPEDVTEISAVCIGAGQGSDGVSYGRGGDGGDLRWRNKFPVTPGETLLLIVGRGGMNSVDIGTRKGNDTVIKRGESVILKAAGGGSVGSSQLSENVGGGDGGSGGLGGSDKGPGGGGGAGGYSGDGGDGGNRNIEAKPGEGGAGGGGAYYLTAGDFPSHHATSGGGVGVYGQGTDGTAGVKDDPLKGGGGGSGGIDGNWISGGLYGSGGRGQSSNNNFGKVNGSNGAIYLVWGPARLFPNERIVL